VGSQPLVYGVCVEELFSAALRVEGSTGESRETHGHDYRVKACVESELLQSGFVVDHYVLRSLLRSCIAPLDHRLANSVINPPTTENLAAHIAGCLEDALRSLGASSGLRVAYVEVCAAGSLCGYVRTSRTA
jgi:6-pyruvoyl-tetrahydropterin synthase